MLVGSVILAMPSPPMLATVLVLAGCWEGWDTTGDNTDLTDPGALDGDALGATGAGCAW